MLQIMRGLLSCGVLISLTWAALAAEPGATTPAGKKLDLTFIPNDAVAAAIVHPQRVIKSPQFALWPTEIFSAGGKKEWGFDPLQIDLAIGVAGIPQIAAAPQPDFAPPAPPQQKFAAVLRFTRAQDVNRVLQLIVKNGRDGAINGKAARLAEQPMLPSAVFVDERTLIVGAEESINWILAAGGGAATDSPLRKQMAAADEGPDAALFVSVEPLRPSILAIVAMTATRLPPKFLELTKLPTLVESIEFRVVSFGQPGAKIELDLTAENERSAGEVQRILKQGLENGKAAIIAQMTEESARDPSDREMNEAMLHYLNRLGDTVVEELEPKQDRDHVLVRTQLQGGGAEVGVLVALLLPAVQAAREAANRNMSQNNLKQIGLGLLNYEDKKHRLPARANFDKDGKPLLSWRVLILPWIEEGDLYQQFHLDEPWDSEHNKKLIEKMPVVYKHPKFAAPGMTLYQGVVGKGFAFDGNEGLKLTSFTDGTSNSILLVEAAPEKAVPWTKPEDFEPDPKNPLNGLGGLFAGGIFNCLFADCHVDGISDGIDPTFFHALLTRNGGEAVNLPLGNR